jgi:hypothetical protein
VTKKNNQTKIKKKKETGSNRSVSIRLSFLEQKPVQIGLTWFFSVWLGFFRFRFGFFGFRLVKPKPN